MTSSAVAYSGRGLFARLRTLMSPRRVSPKAHSPHALLSEGYAFHSFVHAPGKPVWTPRHFSKFADEAYIKNVIAHRAIQLIAQGAASVPWKLHAISASGQKREVKKHSMLSLLASPSPTQPGSEFFESVFAFRLISGNAFIQAVGPSAAPPKELYVLRPDCISIIAGKDELPAAYRYTVGNQATDFAVDRLTGQSRILHLKAFHPLDDWYGLSPVESAAFSIDQHNQSSAWNQSLLQNGARPSGALVVKTGDQQSGTLSEEQYARIKQQVEEQFSGPANAGRPLLLEGGLDWREMSMSPKDMDFIEAKHSAARDIALAFGVPPQLLGIPGDNTYSNLVEARLAMWEQTILPLLDSVCDGLNHWLVPMFGNGLELSCDTDGISALALRREKVWERIEKASFLTDDEKRAAVGYGPLKK